MYSHIVAVLEGTNNCVTFFNAQLGISPIDAVVIATTVHFLPFILARRWSRYSLFWVKGKNVGIDIVNCRWLKYSTFKQSRAFLLCGQATKVMVKIS